VKGLLCVYKLDGLIDERHDSRPCLFGMVPQGGLNVCSLPRLLVRLFK